MSKNKETTALQNEGDFFETQPEIEIKEPESEVDSAQNLNFERLENIINRLERFDFKPEIEIKEPESKSKINIIIFILLFAIGIGGYFVFKTNKKA